MAIQYVLWYYMPSLIGSIVMTTYFGVASLAHLVRLVQTRSRFCVPAVIGGIFEAVGHSARTVAHFHTDKTLPYAIQSLLILLGPILFAASTYMILQRLIRAIKGGSHSLIPSHWITKVFIGGDMLCFIIQGAGGGVLSGAKTHSRVKLGEYIILAGLVLQIVVFGFFVIVAADFHSRARHSPAISATNIPWQRCLCILYFISILISVRNIFRVVEYVWGSSGYALRHEWTLYIFDGALMAAVVLVCLTWYSVDFTAPRTASQRHNDEEAKR
ncbi:uncharacterized protein PV06_10530 [Exophiala oligosperma]|uniref:Uncharacterized protein n=1 Tax=Exophiala oligosperma TaxID=215243 RepID=A0A0D2AAX6_9EURO|nr:uncharacterized protein PV06_10530 [Exophiala oligosperma]KIW37491.1 hypothetical protein PV06_10530 [Exophiala oligosperma]